jgi:hypothetical protein
MNVIGKTLVGLNLVFAVVTLGFLVYDYTARTNWREAAEHNEQVVKLAEASRDSWRQMERNARKKQHDLQAALDAHLIGSGAGEEKLKIQLANQEKELKEAKERASEAVINQNKALEEAKRRQKEVEVYVDVVRKREEDIAKAQAEATRYRNEALTQADIARVANQRTQNLLKQLQEKEKQLVEMQQKGPGGLGTKVAVNSPNYENPPAADVKGKIVKVMPDRNLVQISTGSDVGVSENNTLEVYRLSPRPEYLGRLRVVEAYPHTAIGRMIRTGGVSAPPVQVGDEVASKIR